MKRISMNQKNRKGARKQLAIFALLLALCLTAFTVLPGDLFGWPGSFGALASEEEAPNMETGETPASEPESVSDPEPEPEPAPEPEEEEESEPEPDPDPEPEPEPDPEPEPEPEPAPAAQSDGTGDAGNDNAGEDKVGSGDVDTGKVSSGDVDTGKVGSGDVDTGNVGSGDVDTGNVGSGDNGNGNAGNANVTDENGDDEKGENKKADNNDDEDAGDEKDENEKVGNDNDDENIGDEKDGDRKVGNDNDVDENVSDEKNGDKKDGNENVGDENVDDEKDGNKKGDDVNDENVGDENGGEETVVTEVAKSRNAGSEDGEKAEGDGKKGGGQDDSESPEANAIQKAIDAALSSITEDTKELTIQVEAGEYNSPIVVQIPQMVPANTGNDGGEDNTNDTNSTPTVTPNADFVLKIVSANATKDAAGNYQATADDSVKVNADILVQGINLLLAGIYQQMEKKIEVHHANLTVIGTKADDTVHVEVAEGDGTVTIDTGEGIDTVTVKTAGSGEMDIKTGEGADSVTVSADEGKATDSANESAHEGEDAETNGESAAITIDTGAGDDHVNVDIGPANNYSEVTVTDEDNVTVHDVQVEKANLTITAEKIDVLGTLKANNIQITAESGTVSTEDEPADKLGQIESAYQSMKADFFNVTHKAEINIRDSAKIYAAGDVNVTATVNETGRIMKTLIGALDTLNAGIGDTLNLVNVKVGSAEVNLSGDIESDGFVNIKTIVNTEVDAASSNGYLSSLAVAVAVVNSEINIQNAVIKYR